MAEIINFDTFGVDDDGEDRETATIIDLDTFQLFEKPVPKPVVAEPVQAIPFEGGEASGMTRAPDVDEDEGAFGRNVKQGMINIGGGVLRTIGELRSAFGDEDADKFLQDLEISQNMEQNKTAQISEGEPIKSFLGEVVGETAGFPVGGGGATLAPRLVSGALASATSGGLSAAGRGEDASGVAIEAGIGAVLDPIVQGVGALKKGYQARRQAAELGGVTPEVDAISTAAANLEEATEAQIQTGIRTLPAQKTLDPFLLESQSFIGQNPEVSTKAFNVLKQQNREAATAVSRLLDMIAVPTAPSSAPGQARTAAGNIVSAAVLSRAEASSPIYKQAFRRQRQGKNPLINTSKIELKAEKMAAQFDETGQVSTNIRTILGKIQRAKGDLSKLHNAKLEIDQIIDGRGDNSIGNTTKRFLSGLQKDLVADMSAQSPSYRAARDEFRKNSPLVDEVRAGVFGRIADVQDKDLKRVSGVIFDASESNPEVTINAIRSLKNIEGGGDIAAGLLRTEIEKRLGRMKSELSELSSTGGRKVENVPANLLNTLFGNSKQKSMLMGALKELSPQAAANASWLEKSLISASSGRPGGSQTGIREVITNQLRGVSLGVRSFFRQPIDTVVGIGEEASFSRKAAALGEALYNPEWAPDMARIRKINSNSPEAASRFESLLNKIWENSLKADEISGVTRRAATVAPRAALNDEDEENN